MKAENQEPKKKTKPGQKKEDRAVHIETAA